jgi:hypothetical protein
MLCDPEMIQEFIELFQTRSAIPESPVFAVGPDFPELERRAIADANYKELRQARLYPDHWVARWLFAGAILILIALIQGLFEPRPELFPAFHCGAFLPIKGELIMIYHDFHSDHLAGRALFPVACSASHCNIVMASHEDVIFSIELDSCILPH